MNGEGRGFIGPPPCPSHALRAHGRGMNIGANYPPLKRLSLPTSIFQEDGTVSHFTEAVPTSPESLPAGGAVGFAGEKAAEPRDVDPQIMLGPTAPGHAEFCR